MGLEGLREAHRDAGQRLARLGGRVSDTVALRDLIDRVRRHVALEDRALIPTLSRFLPPDTGPLSVIVEEHDAIRRMLDDLVDRPSVECLGRLDALLRSHFSKEEELLYPFAETHLAAPDLARFDADPGAGAATP